MLTPCRPVSSVLDATASEGFPTAAGRWSSSAMRTKGRTAEGAAQEMPTKTCEIAGAKSAQAV